MHREGLSLPQGILTKKGLTLVLTQPSGPGDSKQEVQGRGAIKRQECSEPGPHVVGSTERTLSFSTKGLARGTSAQLTHRRES